MSQLAGIPVPEAPDWAARPSVSGTVDWQQKTYTISGSGNHLVKWRYVKDYSGSSGSDCGWVDKVEWSGAAPEVTPPAPPGTWTEVGYSYDPGGRRIEKKYDGTTVVKYLYDGDHCIAEYDGNNNLLRKFIYGPAVDEPISMIDVEHASATYYYHFDGLGSVIALTNASGTTAVLYEYSVYGQVAASDPNHPNRFMFTGREFDKETGLYYYRARYYHPEIGRFLQTDPIGYGDGMNWYLYCANNPVRLADPYGLIGLGLGGSGTGGTSGIGGTVGAQIAVDLSGNVGIYIHAGVGGFVSPGQGSATAEISAFTGTIENLNAGSTAVGASGGEGVIVGAELSLSDTPQGQPAVMNSSAQSLTIMIGAGGASPTEVHAFRETGQVFPVSEVISPKIIANYWKDVAVGAARAVGNAASRVAEGVGNLVDRLRNRKDLSDLPPK